MAGNIDAFYRRLIDELVNDPLSIGYANMSDEEVASYLNRPVRKAQGPVSIEDFLLWAGENDILFNLEQTANQGPPNKRAAARAILMLISNPHIESLRLNRAGLKRLFSLALGGVAQGLFDLGTITVSRAQELGLGKVTADVIKSARRLIAGDKGRVKGVL